MTLGHGMAWTSQLASSEEVLDWTLELALSEEELDWTPELVSLGVLLCHAPTECLLPPQHLPWRVQRLVLQQMMIRLI